MLFLPKKRLVDEQKVKINVYVQRVRTKSSLIIISIIIFQIIRLYFYIDYVSTQQPLQWEVYKLNSNKAVFHIPVHAYKISWSKNSEQRGYISVAASLFHLFEGLTLFLIICSFHDHILLRKF